MDKQKQRNLIIKIMRGDEELGLYDDNPLEKKLYDLKMKILRAIDVEFPIREELCNDVFEIEKALVEYHCNCCKWES